MKILHLDIESKPNLVWTWGLFKQNIGLNQIAKPGGLLCFASTWDDGSKPTFLSEWDDGLDSMVEKIWSLLEEADAVCGFNSNRFDITMINREFLLRGMPPPSSYRKIDLLKVARKNFKFNSNKLDNLVQELGLGQKASHAGFSMWTDVMSGCKKAQKQMKIYNMRDTDLLPKLYNRLLAWNDTHPNHALFSDKEGVVCTNCGGTDIKKNGVEHLATQSYQRYRCNTCATPLRGRSTILSPEKRRNILTQSKL